MKELFDRSRAWLIAALVLICLAVLGISSAYTIRVLHLMRTDTDQYLLENAATAADNVNGRIQDDLANLELTARTCANLPDRASRLAHLQTLAGGQALDNVALVELDGTVCRANGMIYHMADDPIIQQILGGATRITLSSSFSPEPTPALIYAAPIRSTDGTILGGLIWRDQKRLVSRWFPEDEVERTLIVESDGIILLNRDREDNLFTALEQRTVPRQGSTLEQLREDLAAGRSGIFYYQDNSGRASLAYTPLTVDGWFLFLRSPTDTLHHSLSEALVLGLLLILAISLVFLIFILLFRRIQHRHTQILEHLAFSDPVTGGDNQVRFSMQAQKYLREAIPGSCAILSVDIQAFSLVNRTFGESAGNQVLRHLYHCFRELLDRDELAARISQDQFALLLRLQEQRSPEERLEETARRFNCFNLGSSTPYYLPLTVGICLTESGTLPVSELLDRANLARKRAKQKVSGPLCTCAWYRPEDQERRLREQNIYNHMEQALENGDFKIYLQPKFSLPDRRVAGAEALVRWQSGEEGLFDPAAFIPVFERNGFITRLDRYMFEQSCRCLREWLDQGLQPVPISVNFSRANLIPGALEDFQAIQRRYRVPPELLEFELTETMVGENPAFFSEVVEAMHRMGFQCSMDDFGSGYSTLHMLQRVSVDTLKLDKSLFDGLLVESERHRSALVAASVIELAHRLGLRTVAEGISSEAQMELLSTLPCDMVQGYYFSRPLPAETFRSRFLCKTDPG